MINLSGISMFLIISAVVNIDRYTQWLDEPNLTYGTWFNALQEERQLLLRRCVSTDPSFAVGY